MPYRFITKKIKLPRDKDRRVSITENQKEDIWAMYKEGLGIREITRRMKTISRRSVQFILFPERLAKVKQQFKDRGQSEKSREKVKGKKWAAIMREHRRYKQKVILEKFR